MKCASICAYMSKLSHSPSFPPLQYNDIVLDLGECAPLAGTTAVAPNGFGGDADEGCNLINTDARSCADVC